VRRGIDACGRRCDLLGQFVDVERGGGVHEPL
jgi:hypothetical protein